MNEQDLSPPPALRRAGPGFLLRHGAHLVALGFGSGLSPMAPGTAASFTASHCGSSASSRSSVHSLVAEKIWPKGV